MKTCTKCLQQKSLDAFFVRDKKTGRLHSQCKLCYKEHRKSYSVEHYRKYGDVYRLRAKARNAAIRHDLHMKMITYLLNKACMICQENDVRVLDFDHINPDLKSFSVAKGITDGLDWGIILSEIKKCRILCANCHRKHTASQRNWYKVLTKEIEITN